MKIETIVKVPNNSENMSISFSDKELALGLVRVELGDGSLSFDLSIDDLINVTQCFAQRYPSAVQKAKMIQEKV